MFKQLISNIKKYLKKFVPDFKQFEKYTIPSKYSVIGVPLTIIIFLLGNYLQNNSVKETTSNFQEGLVEYGEGISTKIDSSISGINDLKKSSSNQDSIIISKLDLTEKLIRSIKYLDTNQFDSLYSIVRSEALGQLYFSNMNKSVQNSQSPINSEKLLRIEEKLDSLIVELEIKIKSDNRVDALFLDQFNDLEKFNILLVEPVILQDCLNIEYNAEFAIRERLSMYNYVRDFGIEIITSNKSDSVLNVYQAKEFGKKKNADFIIWGKQFESCDNNKVNIILEYVIVDEIENDEWNYEETSFMDIYDLRGGGKLSNLDSLIQKAINYSWYNKLKENNELMSKFVNNLDERNLILDFFKNYKENLEEKNFENIRDFSNDPFTLLRFDFNYLFSMDSNNSLNHTLMEIEKKFENEEDVLIGFENVSIMRKSASEIYGLSFYFSLITKNRLDKYYVFLLIDFNADKPSIYVYNIQDGNTPEDELIGLQTFSIKF